MLEQERIDNEKEFGCFMTNAQIERGDCIIIIESEAIKCFGFCFLGAISSFHYSLFLLEKSKKELKQVVQSGLNLFASFVNSILGEIL